MSSRSAAELPSELRDRLEQVVERFEDAWRAGGQPALDEYLIGSGAERRALLIELVHADLHYRLKGGEAARVESYLGKYPELQDDRCVARELIVAEYDLRRRREPGCTPNEYIQRFPDYRDDLAARLHTPPPAPAPPPLHDEVAAPRREPVPPSTLAGAAVAAPGESGTQITPGVTIQLRCPHCQNPVRLADGDADEVLCPGCGSSFRIGDARHTASTVPMRPLGKFQLLERVGAGAFGAVWKARDTTLDRMVALKIPHTGLLTSEQDLERFLREARAAAQLRHPGIVSVHEVVTFDGLPVIATEFVTGVTLKDLIEARPPTWREAAVLVAELAEAVHYAHSMGVVHRDLKPSNIMVSYGAGGTGAASRPRVMDFGLARRPESDATLTEEGNVLGTPAYMSPEQAAGKAHAADARSDVYSLGVILYELLIGQLPFRGSKMMILAQVLNDEPRPPRRLDRRLPPDLDTICLKAMAKDPARRYSTARALADDLRRFLEGRPIQARPTGTAERLVKWARRHPAAAALVGVCGLAAGTLVAVILLSNAQLQRERDHALQEQRTAAAERDAADRARADAEQARRGTETVLVDMHSAFGITAGDQGNPAQALLWFANAARLARNDPERQRVNRVRVRTWKSATPWPVRALPHDGQHPHQIVFHPEGRYALIVAREGKGTLWDLEREEPLPLPGGDRPVSAAAWSPDGAWLALGGAGGDVALGRFPGGEPARRLDVPGPVSALAFSADGRHLAVASRAVRVWDCRDGRFATDELAHPAPVFHLAWSARGDRLATGCRDGMARVFAVPGESGKTRTLFDPVPCGGIKPLFVNGDRGLLTVLGTRAAVLRDATTGRPLHQVAFGGVAQIYTAEASPDGRYFALAGFNEAQLWEAASGTPVGQKMPHVYGVVAIAFSPDGGVLLTGSMDRTARLWSVPDGKPLSPPLSHSHEVRACAFSPDGRLLVAAQEDGLVRCWAPVADGPEVCRILLDGPRGDLALSADGAYLMPAGSSLSPLEVTAARVYEVATGEPAGPPLPVQGGLYGSAFSPDGRQAVTLSARQALWPGGLVPNLQPGTVRFWDWRAGTSGAPVQTPSQPLGAAYTPDGRRVAVLCAGGQVLLLDPAAGQVTARFDHGSAQQVSYQGHRWVEFAADARTLLTWGLDKALKVWDLEPGRLRFPPLQHDGVVQEAHWSPDRRFLVTASVDHTVRIWDFATGRLAAATLAHPDWVFNAKFSPDGDRVITACRDHMARVWDWRTGRLVCPALEHANEVYDAVFSPDGRWLFTVSTDNTARVWEGTTGKLVSPPWVLPSAGQQLLLTPDGARAVVVSRTSGRATAQVFTLRDLDDPDPRQPSLDDLCTLGELVSGRRVHDSGVVNLTSTEWLARWRGLRRERPDLLPWPEKRSWQPLGADHPDTLRRIEHLARLYHARGQYADAEPLFRQVLEARRRKLGPDNSATLRSMNQLAVAYWSRKKLNQSIPLFEETLALQTKKLPADHPDRLITLTNLAVNYRDAGRLGDAIRCFEQALAAARKRPGPLPDVLDSMPLLLGETYQRANQFDKAEVVYRDFLEEIRRQRGADDPRIAGALALLGASLLRQNKHAGAEKVLRDCLALRQTKEPGGWVTFNTQSMLGEALLRQKHYADAEPLLLAGYEGMKARAKMIPPPGKFRLPEAAERLVQLYDSTGKQDEAARWRKELERYRSKLVGPVQEVGAGLELKGQLDAKTTALVYQVKLLAAKTYVIDMVSPDQKALDPFLVLSDGAGKKMAEDDDSGGGLNARIVYRAEQTGVFHIRATSFNGGSGAFTLTVREQPMQPRKEKG